MSKYIGVADNASNNINANLNVKIVDTNEINIISTTLSSSLVAGNGVTATPASMTGIGVGTPLLIDLLSNSVQETVTVLTVTGTTFTANFRFAHASGVPVILSVERQNMSIADPTGLGLIASVAVGPALSTDTGLTVRTVPQPLTTGTNSIGNVGLNTGANTIGAVNQAGTWTTGLNAGTNIVGKFGIDQTTSGVTNGVVVNQPLPAGANLIGQVTLSGTSAISGNIGINNGSNSIGFVGLNSGSNVVGGFNINQATPGTTNGVQITGPGVSTANPLFAQASGVYNSSAPTLTSGNANAIQLDINGNQKVVLATQLPTGTNTLGAVNLNAGVNLLGKVGIDQTTPGTTNGVQINAALPTGSNVIGGVTQSGTWTVTSAASTNIIGNIRIDQTTPGTTNGVVVTTALPAGSATIGAVNLNAGSNSIGNVGLNVGSNVIGKVTIDQTTPGTTNAIQVTGPGTASSNPLFNEALGVYNAAAPTLTSGNPAVIQLDVNGNQKVNLITPLPAGSATIGNVGLISGSNVVGKFSIDQTTPGSTNGVQLLTALPTGSNTIGAVNLNAGSNVIGAVTQSGTWTVGVNTATPAGTNIIGKIGIDQTTPGSTNGVQLTGIGTVSTNPIFAENVGVYNSTAPSLTNGQSTTLQLDANGNQKTNLATALPTGANTIGAVNVNGTVTTTGTTTVVAALPTGANSIGTVGLNAGTNLVGKVGIDQTTPGTTNGVVINAALPTGGNTIGAINQAGTWSVGLNAGSSVVGKFGIDQTTPGSTNGVQLTGPGSLVTTPLFAENIGIYNSSAPTLTTGSISTIQLDVNGNQKVTVAAALPTGGNVIGLVGLNTGANSIGTVGLNTGANVVGKFGIDQTTPGTTNGVVVNAALPTGANTIGAVVNAAGANSIGTVGLNAGTNLVGKFGIDQTTPGTTNAVQVSGPGTSVTNSLFSQNVGIYSASAPTLTNGQASAAQLDISGNQKVTLATSLPTGTNGIGSVTLGAGSNSVGSVGINAGSNIIGKFGIDQTTPGTTNGIVINSALPTGSNSIGLVGLNAGTNTIGAVNLNAGTNIIGSFRIDQTTPGTTNAIQVTGPGTSSSNPLFAEQVGVYNTTPPTLTNGQIASTQVDVNGNQKVTLATSLPTGTNSVGNIGTLGSITGTVTTQSFNDSTLTAAYVAQSGVNVIKNSTGRLVSAVVTVSPTVNVFIYDSATAASGTIIGAIPLGAPVGYVQVFAMPAANGITVAGGTTNGNFTLAYR